MIPLLVAATARANGPLDIGSRLEPIVDDTLIERLDGTALRLHPPAQREIVLTPDRPWEGIYSGYYTVIKDGRKYRLYYRGLPVARHALDTEVTCVAESSDGVHWTKPNLGLYEVHGTKDNNVILSRHAACHNFAPFLDANPDAAAEQRYKALGGSDSFQDPNGCGLFAFVSADGIHWRQLGDRPVIRRAKNDKRHAFDSQNVAFWSAAEGCYVCYFRIWADNNRIRWIGWTTSKDFLDWTPAEELTADNRPLQQLYTSQLAPYVRAPHIYLGMPTRFMQGRRALDAEQMAALGTPKQYANDCTDITLVSARGGKELKRTFLEAYIRPGLDPHHWTSRANYAARGIVQTAPDELSIYVAQHVGYPTIHLRRYALRPDGFASVNAPLAGGEVTTKPLRFTGNRLEINFATSAAGGVQVEIQDADGRPIPGFTLADCGEIIGDRLAHTVAWKSGADLGNLAGRPVRLRFVLRDADLYALQFVTN